MVVFNKDEVIKAILNSIMKYNLTGDILITSRP